MQHIRLKVVDDRGVTRFLFNRGTTWNCLTESASQCRPDDICQRHATLLLFGMEDFLATEDATATKKALDLARLFMPDCKVNSVATGSIKGPPADDKPAVAKVEAVSLESIGLAFSEPQGTA